MKTYIQAQYDKRLNHSTFRLYSIIHTSIQYGNGFTMTDKEINDKIGLAKGTINTSIKQLIELGYVTKSKGQKVNIDGQIRILNDESYRTLNVTDKVEVKTKKVSAKKEEGIKTFEIFWKNRVRNKKGKEAALKSWLRLTIEEQRLAYKMIGYYYNTVSDAKYYAHMSSWLNGKRFNDEDLIPSHESNSGSRWNQHVERTDEERAERRRIAINKLKENLDK